MNRVSVNGFTNPSGERVYQAFVGGITICREMSDRAAAVNAAEDAIARSYVKSQRYTWDGDVSHEATVIGAYTVTRRASGWHLEGPSFTGYRRNNIDAVNAARYWEHMDNASPSCRCLECSTIRTMNEGFHARAC